MTATGADAAPVASVWAAPAVAGGVASQEGPEVLAPAAGTVAGLAAVRFEMCYDHSPGEQNHRDQQHQPAPP